MIRTNTFKKTSAEKITREKPLLVKSLLEKPLLEKPLLKKQLLVKPLSQSDLAEGWRLIVPKIRYTDKKTNNMYRSKVNLAQLPYHLWSKRSHNSRISEKSHIYYVHTTEVDREIQELGTNIMSGTFALSRENTVQLLRKIKEYDVHGWPIIKAMNLYQLKNSDI